MSVLLHLRPVPSCHWASRMQRRIQLFYLKFFIRSFMQCYVCYSIHVDVMFFFQNIQQEWHFIAWLCWCAVKNLLTLLTHWPMVGWADLKLVIIVASQIQAKYWLLAIFRVFCVDAIMPGLYDISIFCMHTCHSSIVTSCDPSSYLWVGLRWFYLCVFLLPMYILPWIVYSTRWSNLSFCGKIL